MGKRSMGKRRSSAKQGELPLRTRGGRRPGAGRKPRGEKAGVSHRRRPAFASRHPLHATLKLAKGLSSLRQKEAYRALRAVFAVACERFGFRLVHFSVQRDHLHLIVEAADAAALARGMQGLAVRVAKALNRVWGRKGRVFADRYHARPLKTPREVRHALAYVLNNAWRHRGYAAHHPDAYASGWWFDGWRESFTARNVPAQPTAPARTWLLKVGWRRHGLLSLAEVPARGSA